MKTLTFDEFFALPPGAIFGQATGLPHQCSTGLFRKGECCPADDEMPERCIEATNLCADDHGKMGMERFIYSGSVDDDHWFLVYEADDLAWLREQLRGSTP